MTNTADSLTATDPITALNEYAPDASYGAIPVIDYQDALEAYLAFEDGALAEAPQALATYIRHQQCCVE